MALDLFSNLGGAGGFASNPISGATAGPVQDGNDTVSVTVGGFNPPTLATSGAMKTAAVIGLAAIAVAIVWTRGRK